MKKETRIIFTGDIGFDKYMEDRWKDENLLSDEVRKFLNSGDHLAVNVEGPLSDCSKRKMDNAAAAGLMHSMNPEVSLFLEDLGADIWNLCNNHIMDAGPEGLRDTLNEAASHKAFTLGVGMNIAEAIKPVILEEAGGIGMIGVGYQRACRKADENTPGCFSWSDMDLIKKSIEDIKSKCRWCIVVAHGGEEFTALPSPYTRERYLSYLDMGADIVIGHHPHVPMNYEKVGEKTIFYSLGNFIFDTDYQRSQFNTEKGLFVGIEFTENSYSFEPFGILIERISERIIEAEIPDIFADVNEEEYELLKPLAAKMFIENTKRQLKYMKPDKFANATDEEFIENFYEPLRSGRVPGECLDMQIIYPLSLEADNGKWRESKLEKVKGFITEQID